jgi:hypothetical protein
VSASVFIHDGALVTVTPDASGGRTIVTAQAGMVAVMYAPAELIAYLNRDRRRRPKGEPGAPHRPGRPRRPKGAE